MILFYYFSISSNDFHVQTSSMYSLHVQYFASTSVGNSLETSCFVVCFSFFLPVWAAPARMEASAVLVNSVQKLNINTGARRRRN